MNNNRSGQALNGAARTLREQAEAQVREKRDELPENLSALAPDDVRKLLHELRVHQVELEMQNEELKAAQVQLQAAQARYFDLYDRAPVGYLTLDVKGLIQTANFTAAKLFAAGKRPFAGQPLTRFILPEDQDIFHLHRRQLEKGAAKDCELRMLGAGDAPFWARLASNAGPRPGDDALVWRITVSDITEARLAQAAAARAARDWQETFDTVSDVIWVLDADSRIARANLATERIFGRTAGEVLGKYCYTIAHGALRRIKDCPLRRAKKSMRREKMEMQAGEKTFEVIIYPVADKAGRFNGAVQVVTDITARKKSEAETRRLLARLEAKSSEMESFLHITTHDLRTPLINVQGFSQSLEEHVRELRGVVKPLPLPEKVRGPFDKLTGERIPADLNFITAGVQRMDQVLTAMLRVYRAGGAQLSRQTVDAGKIVRNILSTMSYQLEEAGAEVTLGALPPCTADPESVNHIFSNLLANAVKYRDKHRKLRITIGGEAAGNGAVVYSVADNGLGIKAADLPRIWQIFYSGNIPGVKKGEGVGLPLARRLAEKNSGSIWARSEEGEGTTFFVELPA